MAQGAKPGEGGQLPGRKVSPEIARVRSTRPGVTLISPPPHHDIYSIEDLAQLVADLKTFPPAVRVSVKLASEPGVGVIAVGVAKAHADGVVISGHEGGTGASPLTSTKHAGSPWEIGLAEAHQTLVESGIRGRVVLEVDGGLRTGRDVVIAALLGAERFGFGTLPLLALGCKMVRRCHLDACPVGIATQRPDLRARFAGNPEQVVTLFRLLAGEVRRHLAALGARSLEEIIGRSDLLRPADSAHPVARALDDLLVPFPGRAPHERFEPPTPSPLGGGSGRGGRGRLESATPGPLAHPITNTDRAVGTRLAGLIAARYPSGLPEGSITIRLTGTAGQSLGAFLVPGVHLHLEGTANDGVGKGMAGGSIAIVPRRAPGGGAPHGAGNAALYGATGGRLFVGRHGGVALRGAQQRGAGRRRGMPGPRLRVHDGGNSGRPRPDRPQPGSRHDRRGALRLGSLRRSPAPLRGHLTPGGASLPVGPGRAARLAPGAPHGHRQSPAAAVLDDWDRRGGSSGPCAPRPPSPTTAEWLGRPYAPGEPGHPNAPGGPAFPDAAGETPTAGGWRR